VPLLLLLLVAAAVTNGGSTAPPVPSDRRLKTDVRAVGMTAHGLAVYRYRYRGLPGVYQGVMAQDVACLRPDAVRPLAGGFLAVDYGSLGLALRRVA
jgi:hypothetical protein